MTPAQVANLIPDTLSRRAWIRAGMPTDLARVAEIVTTARQGIVFRNQQTPTLVARRRASFTTSI